MGKLLLAVVEGYLFGSISSSVILSNWLFHTDVRCHGSGNAGATNAARVFGMGLGLLTLLCDAAKTAAAVYLGQALGGAVGFALAGGACLVGHCWPVFFHFRGGKGVTVGAVLALLLDWRVFLTIAALFFLLFVCSRTVSVCSVGAALALPAALFAFQCPLPECLLGVFAAILVVFQHRSNLVRLARHTEPRFHAGSPADARAHTEEKS